MNKIYFKLLLAMTQNVTKTFAVAVMTALSASVAANTATADNPETDVRPEQADVSIMPMATNGTDAIGIAGLDELVGLTEAQLRANAVTQANYPDDDNKVFFLYNV